MGSVAQAGVQDIATTVVRHHDIASQQQVVRAVVGDADTRRALGSYRAAAADIVSVQNDVATTSKQITNDPGIGGLVRCNVEVRGTGVIERLLQCCAAIAPCLEFKQVAAAGILCQLAIAIYGDVELAVAPGHHRSIDDHIPGVRTRGLIVTHRNRDETDLVARGRAVRIAEHIIAISTQRHECATEQLAVLGKRRSCSTVHRGAGRRIRNGYQALAIPQGHCVASDTRAVAIHPIHASGDVGIVQGFKARAFTHLDILVHLQIDSRVRLAYRSQDAPGIDQCIGTHIGLGIGTDVEHVIALQLGVGTDSDLVHQRRIGLGLDDRNVDRATGGQTGTIIRVRVGSRHDIQTNGIAPGRTTAGVKLGAVANINSTAAGQCRGDLGGTAGQDAAAGGTGGELADENTVDIVFRSQPDGTVRGNPGLLAHAQDDVGLDVILSVRTAGVEYARTGAVRAGAIFAGVRRSRHKLGHIPVSQVPDGYIRCALGYRPGQRCIAGNQAASARRGIGGVLVLSACIECDGPGNQPSSVTHPCMHSGGGFGGGLHHASSQQPAHADARGISVLGAHIGGCDGYRSAAFIGARYVLIGSASHARSVHDVGAHGIAALGGCK